MRVTPKILLGALSLGVVLALFYHDLERTSPGALSRTHAQDPKLATGNDCSACHGGGELELSDACLTCHAPIAAQLASESGFHGTLAGVPADDCGRCHLEHHGPDFRLVGTLGFREAGFATREEYEHDSLGLSLAGAHLELACADCHDLADAELLKPGQARFLGLDPDCATCHDDPHRGSMALACDACHGQEQPFAELARFSHSADFALAGGHAGLGCAECHAPGGPHAVEVLAGRGPLPAPRSCADCHEDPHRASFLTALARRAPGAAEGQSCQLCHDAEHGSFRARETFEFEADWHRAAGFELDGPHDVDCARCHGTGAGDATYAQRFPGRRESDCAACHTDPHDGAMGSSCADCHTLPGPFRGLEGFAHTAFALRGAHAQLACADCHDPTSPTSVEALAGPGPRPPTRTCLDCHGSPHSPAFQAGVAAALRVGEPGSCAECHDPHSTDRFAELTRQLEPALHAHTTFPLDGPHVGVSCEGCHGAAGLPFELRYPGRAPEQCSACHADVHQGQFEGRPTAAEGCLSCHQRHAFVPATFGVAEHAFSPFRLEGSHRAVACVDCHEFRDARPRRFAGTGTACEACHADAHAGAFERPGLPVEVDGDAGCARCHTPDLFSEVDHGRFDHGTWTGFPLEGAHARVGCESCHLPARERDATGRRFGFATSRDCAACHADPHVGQFARSGATDCTRCHSAEVPFAQVSFDHDTHSRFALDAQHRDLACSACHLPWPLPDGGQAVRFKPLGTACSDCHATSKGEGKRR